MQQKIFNIDNKKISVYIRDEADESVAAEIFSLREYRIAEPVLKSTSQTIVDAGAHSGMFCIYARTLNPVVKIIAIEPEKNNLELLKKHFEKNDLQNTEIVSGALAGENGRKRLLFSSDSHTHRLVPTATEGKTEIVQAFDLKNIINRCPGKTIGLLKMDIEGGEYDVFSTINPEDLAVIGAVVMEYHNSNTRNYKEIENKLRENGFGVQIFPSKFDKTMGFLWAVNKRK